MARIQLEHRHFDTVCDDFPWSLPLDKISTDEQKERKSAAFPVPDSLRFCICNVPFQSRDTVLAVLHGAELPGYPGGVQLEGVSMDNLDPEHRHYLHERLLTRIFHAESVPRVIVRTMGGRLQKGRAHGVAVLVQYEHSAHYLLRHR